MLEVTDPRHNPLGRAEHEVERETLLASFLDIAYAETTAALIVMRALIADEVVAKSISRELANRRHPMPGWLGGLSDARVASEVVLITHELGDGDDYVFSVELSPREQLSVVVFVDHNMGSAVKDAFVLPIGHEELLVKLRETMSPDPGSSIRAVDPADARHHRVGNRHRGGIFRSPRAIPGLRRGR